MNSAILESGITGDQIKTKLGKELIDLLDQ